MGEANGKLLAEEIVISTLWSFLAMLAGSQFGYVVQTDVYDPHANLWT